MPEWMSQAQSEAQWGGFTAAIDQEEEAMAASTTIPLRLPASGFGVFAEPRYGA